MSEKMIVEQCSPTLAGMKTGSVFHCSYENEAELHSEISRFNGVLIPKGLRMLPLKKDGRRALIYVYRPTQLEKDVNESSAIDILKSYGYSSGCESSLVARLRERLCESECFPHEIGLFLGYPPEDVKGFIDNKAASCKCCGYWKVYGDEKKAGKTFDKFRKCTKVYCGCYERSACFHKLIVGQ